jgi:hypothetical protein
MMLTILLFIFGMNAGEFISFLGLLFAGIGGLIWVNVRLAQLELKIKEIEIDMAKSDEKIDKIEDKLQNKVDKIDEKIDHIIETVNEIKVQCVKKCNYTE